MLEADYWRVEGKLTDITAERDKARADLEELQHWLSTMAAAERTAMVGASRAERVGRKAAAEAYETALERVVAHLPGGG